MDLARLLVAYGPPLAIGLTALALLWLYYLTRLGRPLVPQSYDGWITLGILVVFLVLLRNHLLYGINAVAMLILSALWLVWFTRKSKTALREPTVVVVEKGKPEPGNPLVKIACALLLLSGAQGFLYEINFIKQRHMPELLAFYDRPLPDLPYIRAADHSRHTIAELKGKVVLVNFWRTDCGSSCEGNMKHMERLYERYKDHGLAVVHLSSDRSDTTLGSNSIMAYAEQNKSAAIYGTLAAHEHLVPPFDRYPFSGETTSVPITLVIDREGILRQVISGSALPYKYFFVGAASHL